MSKLALSALLWLGAFLSLELVPVFWKGCPWFTLSSTVSGGIRWWHPLGLLVAVFMFTLYGHFDRGWSWAWIVAEGALIAVAIGLHLELAWLP